MNYVGSCSAVYSPHSYSNILKVIKQLLEIDYSNYQLSVIGRRVNVTVEESVFFRLLKSFRHKKIENHFWDDLREISKGEISFQTSEFDSIAVMGELSHLNLKKNQAVKIHDPYTEIRRQLYLVGIPETSFDYYETILKNGQLLLIIHGTYQELKQAGNLLDLTGNINVSLHLTNTN